LFCFDAVPRLSVDIDLNYIGHLDKEKMQEERILINEGITQILQGNQFALYRNLISMQAVKWYGSIPVFWVKGEFRN